MVLVLLKQETLVVLVVAELTDQERAALVIRQQYLQAKVVQEALAAHNQEHMAVVAVVVQVP